MNLINFTNFIGEIKKPFNYNQFYSAFYHCEQFLGKVMVLDNKYTCINNITGESLHIKKVNI